VWKTETPLPVVGFSLGDFKTKETKIGTPLGGELTIDAYANTQPPSFMEAVAQQVDNSGEGSVGSLSTLPMLASELSQGEMAVKIYTNYFGALPFPHIALTQQSACNYGQSWPMMVYLPVCGFLDQTQQHTLGLRSEDMYWKIVTPHEVAHQWWGQTVGFRSYRDQWMSEGFANTSASIYLQLTRPKPNDFIDFWKQERKALTEKNQFGFRPIDVGPVTMGSRLSTPKAGWDIYQNLVYPKGAYILHMIRMMMWTPKEGDARFKATMQDFVNTYRLKPATTEDFKAMVEKHMSPSMDLERNHTMDWFFREYVYGTDLPAYHFEGNATPEGEGWKLHFKLTQSNVGPEFANAVPLYLELADGKVMRLGLIAIHGATTSEQTVTLPKLPAAIKKVTINYYYDVLCTDN
jgi:aminopeptidase N